MIQGIIFDLDGVIVHTDKFHYQAWKMLADELNIYFDQQINNRLRGVSRMESLDIILQNSLVEYSLPQKQEFAEQKNQNYRKLLQNMSPSDVSSEVLSTLQQLSGKVKTAIGSSSKNTSLILDKIGLDNFFNQIADGNMITNSKPDPEVFLLAAKKLNLPPQNCIVVEDAEAGLQAALAGGFVAAGYGSSCSSPLANINLQSFSQILNYI